MIILVSADDGWLRVFGGKIASHFSEITSSGILIEKITEKLSRAKYNSQAQVVMRQLGDVVENNLSDDQKFLVIFDMSSHSHFGSFDASDHAGAANVFGALCLRFPHCDFRIYGEKELLDYEMRSLSGLSVNHVLTPSEALASLEGLYSLAASSIYDASGLRNFIRLASWKNNTSLGREGLPERKKLAVVVDDDEHTARLLGLSMYVAGYRVGLVWDDSAFHHGLQAPATFKPVHVSLEPVALSQAGANDFGIELSIEARRERSLSLREAKITLLVTSDLMATKNWPTSTGKFAAINFPLESIYTPMQRLQKLGYDGEFSWPPSNRLKFKGVAAHSTPAQLTTIARGLFASYKAARAAAPIASTVFILEAMELVLARQSTLSMELVDLLHASLLDIEICNISQFMAGDVRFRVSRLEADIEAALRSFNTSDSDKSRIRRQYKSRSLARLIGIYRSGYHFEEEISLLQYARSNAGNILVKLAERIIGSWHGFLLSIVFWITVFGLLFTGFGTQWQFSAKQLLAGLTYSAVTFSTVGVAPSDWLHQNSITESIGFGWLIFIEAAVAYGHWALIFAQAFFWFSRR